MVEETGSFKKNLRNITFKALKATIMAVIFYALYYFVMQFIGQMSEMVPGLQETIDTFFVVYIVLMILGTLTSGTIFQYFFNTAKSLFVIAYMLLSLNGGIFSIDVENLSLMVDIRFFLMIAMMLSLLGLAKSLVQAINFLNERAEYGHIQKQT